MLAAQRVGTFGRVFAYEPNPRRLTLLSKSIAINLMHDRVVTRPEVVGDASEDEALAFMSEESRRVRVATGIVNSKVGETIEPLEANNASIIDMACVTLDQEFPVDLPIKLLKMDVKSCESAILKGARRLLERRCIDFILLAIPPDRWGSQWSELLTQLNWLAESNYIPCTLTPDGSPVEHDSVRVALDRLEGSGIVMVARDQYASNN